jgi:hypothetical protein
MTPNARITATKPDIRPFESKVPSFINKCILLITAPCVAQTKPTSRDPKMSLSSLSLDDVDDVAAEYTKNPAELRVLRFPTNEQLDDIVVNCLGRLTRSNVLAVLKGAIDKPTEAYSFDPVPGRPDMLRVSSNVRFSNPDGSERELYPPPIARQRIKTVHPTSVILTRRWLRDGFRNEEGAGASAKENLAPRWNAFRTRLLAEAKRSGGLFNLFLHRNHIFCRRGQIAASDKLPPLEREREFQMPVRNASPRALNVGDLKDALMLAEGGFGGPLRRPLPEDLKDTVVVTRDAMLVIPVPTKRPLASASGLIGLELDKLDPGIYARRKEETEWTNIWRESLTGALVDPLQQLCLVSDPSSNGLLDSVDTLMGPCFFCSKPTGYRFIRNTAISGEHSKRPLQVCYEDLILLACRPVQGERNTCARACTATMNTLCGYLNIFQHTVSEIPQGVKKGSGCWYPLCESKISNPLHYKAKLQRCSKCQVAQYCGSNCQRLHWKEHKISCARAD